MPDRYLNLQHTQATKCEFDPVIVSLEHFHREFYDVNMLYRETAKGWLMKP